MDPYMQSLHTMARMISDSDLCGLHRHCFMCFRERCNGDGDACPRMECPRLCGRQFHMCKAEEHKELCSNARVPCLNESFGCDLELARKDRVAHLEKCPASIVYCSIEWNRWPLYCTKRLQKVPFRHRNPRGCSGQLDYDLASRDHRMSLVLREMPRCTRLALRSNLTRRHPALPGPQPVNRKIEERDRNEESLELQAKFEVPENVPVGEHISGIARTFGKTQTEIYKRWQEDVDRAIARTGQPVPKKYWEFAELEKGGVHEHCAYCVKRECNAASDDREEWIGREEWSWVCSMMPCQWDCGATFHRCKVTEHKMICPLYREEDEVDWYTRDGMGRKREKLVEEPLKLAEDMLVGLPESVNKSKIKKGKLLIPKPPPMPKQLHSGLRFDICEEAISKLEQKPRDMYTFMCGHELRRDEYGSHLKNVHDDILGSLNNWMEARCPLASQGCGFSSRRLYPGNHPGNAVTYSQVSESFGVIPHQIQVKPAGGKKKPKKLTLEQMPVEIVLDILNRVDARSLGSVSLVSVRLRELACSLLDTRGCVSLVWGREGARGWRVLHRRWFYSCAFEPVLTWGHNGDADVANHLKVCPYNLRTVHKPMPRNDKTVQLFVKDLKQYLIIYREHKNKQPQKLTRESISGGRGV